MNRSDYIREVKEMLADTVSESIDDNLLTLNAVFRSQMTTVGVPRPSVTMMGWNLMNQFIRGFSPNEFTILCGPTGSGKTTLLATWALELASANVPFYMASVEIGSGEFVSKMIGSLYGKDFNDIQESEKESALKKCSPILGSQTSLLTTYESRVSHFDMLADILYAHQQMGTKIAFIDNLNFMLEVKRSSDQLLEMDRVIHDFIIFCKRVPIHIVMVMHPRKTEGGRVVSEFDIKGSSTAVQEAANVLLLNRMDRDAPIGHEQKLCRDLTIAKSRFNGRHQGKRIILAMNKQSELLREIAYD